MEPHLELLELGRGLGMRRTEQRSSDEAAAGVRRIMHAVDITRQVTGLSLEFQSLQDHLAARLLVDQGVVDERERAVEHANTTMGDILRHKSKLVERLRATKMSETIPVEQQHQRDLQQLLEACARDLHADDQGAEALQWAAGFQEPTTVWEERTRLVADAAQALEAMDQQERARSGMMDQLVRAAAR